MPDPRGQAALERVFINAATMRQGGAITHMRTFLPSFLALRPSTAVSILVPEASRDVVDDLDLTVFTHKVPAGSPLLRTYVDQVLVRRLGRSADVVLSVLNHGPIALSKPHILWARNQLYFQEPASAVEVVQNRSAMAAMKASDCVLFPSVSTRLSAERAGFHGEAQVVGHPISCEPCCHQSGERDSHIRILVPTSAQPHKNLSLVPQVSYELSKLGVSHQIHVTAPGFSTSSQLGTVTSVCRYSDASIFAHYDCIFLPSLVESFSYPLLEAQIFGVPVAASDIPPHREYGILAELFEPNAPKAGARAIDAVMSRPASAATQIRARLRVAHDPVGYAEKIWSIAERVVATCA